MKVADSSLILAQKQGRRETNWGPGHNGRVEAPTPDHWSIDYEHWGPLNIWGPGANYPLAPPSRRPCSEIVFLYHEIDKHWSIMEGVNFAERNSMWLIDIHKFKMIFI